MLCCVRGANGLADVVVVRVVVPNGEEALLELPNGEVFATVALGVPPKVPAFANIGLEDVSVLPNVLLATAIPNPASTNCVEFALLESSCCELVTNGPPIVALGVPNGALLLAAALIFCPPKTFGADVAAPKVLLLDC